MNFNWKVYFLFFLNIVVFICINVNFITRIKFKCFLNFQKFNLLIFNYFITLYKFISFKFKNKR